MNETNQEARNVALYYMVPIIISVLSGIFYMERIIQQTADRYAAVTKECKEDYKEINEKIYRLEKRMDEKFDTMQQKMDEKFDRFMELKR